MRPPPRIPPALLVLWCVYALAAALGYHAAFREPKRVPFARSAAPPAPTEPSSATARAETERAAPARWAALAPAPELAAEFLPPDAPAFSARDVALGARLFTGAWTPGARTCADCHDPLWGYGSGGSGDAPSLLDLPAREAYRSPAGWRALEARIARSIREGRELGAREGEAEQALQEFAASLDVERDDHGSAHGLDSIGAARAIAAFLALQRSGPSAFDREREGVPALSALQRRGQALFEGEAGCAACHRAPRFDVPSGGTLRDLELRPPYGPVRHRTLRELLADHAPPNLRTQEPLAALESFLRALSGERSFPFLPDRAPAKPTPR